MRSLSIPAALVLLLGLAIVGAPAGAEEYSAELRPLNAEALGRSASGTATLTVEGDRLTITVEAEGLTPGVMHLQEDRESQMDGHTRPHWKQTEVVRQARRDDHDHEGQKQPEDQQRRASI